MAYQLRPEMPLEGMSMSKIFPGVDLKKRYEGLSRAASPYEIAFNEITRASNSRQALEASEYARDKGHFDSFHSRVFRAYFIETLDIGDLDVILGLAREDGLDSDDLRRALKEKQYQRASRRSEAGGGVGMRLLPSPHSLLMANTRSWARSRSRLSGRNSELFRPNDT